MAAYAALVSLMHIIDTLQTHPRPPISLDNIQVESLIGKVSFLQEFLEAYNPILGYSTEADPLESRVADAAYAAEDIIESHIVDQITNDGPEKISLDGLHQGLAKVIQDMASIEKEAMDVRQTMRLQHHQCTKSAPPDSLRSSSIVHNSSMVGVDDVLRQMKEKLTSDGRDRKIIPIVGMGGTGKTTLAANIYQDPLIQEHFHIHAWATISQEYSIRGIFAEVLRKLKNEEIGQHLSENELGDMLHKYLFGRKYLIVMDDIWNIEAWVKVGRFFPDSKNGSRIVITTRLLNLASELSGSNNLEMRLLDEDSSWDLLSKTVFRGNDCPLALEEIGKKIAKSCRGLPLSIIVVGGFLAKSKNTTKFWEYIEENLNSIVNSVEDESCLRILHMSYKQLPVYLKPCFLYMGVFPEDMVISVSRVTKLWVAEGFLKPIKGKSLEVIAKEYLKELADRNLILIHEMGTIGSIKKCKMHDLLRDLCLREAGKERFYTVARQYAPRGVAITQCRVVISITSQRKNHVCDLQSVPLARSLIWNHSGGPPSLNLSLLRIFESPLIWNHYEGPPSLNLIMSRTIFEPRAELEKMFELVNLRYLSGRSLLWDQTVSSVYRLWNLETVIAREGCEFVLSAEIWSMPQIRHVEFNYVHLPDPPSGSQNDDIDVLGNLHTLMGIIDFKCSEEVVKRIPNLKKLKITYQTPEGTSCLNNLACLQKLESLDCCFYSRMHLRGPDHYVQSLNFPHSLKKLKLEIGQSQCWQDIMEKIGTLPLLQKLTLNFGYFEEWKWETGEGQFQSLKYLQLFCCALKQWTMESSNFPRLERLVLVGLYELEEIPLDAAEIPTLGVIEVRDCSESAAISAKRIVEEQEESNGEPTIQVLVIIEQNNQAVESLASRNIRVQNK